MIRSYEKFEAVPVEREGAQDVRKRVLISRVEGATNFYMRMFEVKPNGFTPYHKHDFEHEVYVLEGRGLIKSDSTEKPVNPGDVIFVAPNEEHQFRNISTETLKFLCMIPSYGE